MKRIILSSFLILTLAGCATQGKYKAKLDTWMGHKDTELALSWGPPQSSMTIGNQDVWSYSNSRSVTMPTQATTNIYGNTAQTNIYGGQQLNFHCTTNFYIDRSTRKVVSWRFQGNNCVSR